MAKRRTKEEIRIERETDAACQKYSAGYSIPVMKLQAIYDAGFAAGIAGQSIVEAVKTATALYGTPEA